MSCFRVYDADLPDYAAAIDVYRRAGAAAGSDPSEVVEQWVCIQEYAAPQTIDPEKVGLRTRELVTVAQLV